MNRKIKAMHAADFYDGLVRLFGEEAVDVGAGQLAEQLEELTGALAKASNVLRDIFGGTTSSSSVARSLVNGEAGKQADKLQKLAYLYSNIKLSDYVDAARLSLILADEIYEMQTTTTFRSLSSKAEQHFILKTWGLTPQEEQDFWDCMYIFDHAYGFESRWNRDDLLYVMQGEGFPYAADMDDDMNWSEWTRLVNDYEKKLERKYFGSRTETLDSKAEEYSQRDKRRLVNLGESGFDY